MGNEQSGITCGHCQAKHATADEVRECGAYQRYLADDTHFCEDPTCALTRNCAAYRYDAHANGFWGRGEEEQERRGWAHWDAEMARAERLS